LDGDNALHKKTDLTLPQATIGPEGRHLIATPVRACTPSVIHDGAPKVRQSNFGRLSADCRTFGALSGSGSFSTPSRAWLLTNGPSGLNESLS